MEVCFLHAIRKDLLLDIDGSMMKRGKSLSYWSTSAPEVQTNTFVVKAGEDELFVITEYLAVWFYVSFFIVSDFCEDIRIDSYV